MTRSGYTREIAGKAGVVVDHAETSRYNCIALQADNDGEYHRDKMMLMKLPDIYGPLSTDNSPLHDPPSERVNASPPCKEQVSQATPVAKEPVSVFQEQESKFFS